MIVIYREWTARAIEANVHCHEGLWIEQFMTDMGTNRGIHK